MLRTLIATLGVTSLLSGAWAIAAEAPKGELLVLSKSDRTLSIIDPTGLKVMAKVPVGPDPHEVVASADGQFAYVSNYGFGAYNTITPVDLAARKALPAIDLGALRGPHGLAYAGGKVWFTAEVAKAIARYDPARQVVDWVLGTGQNRTHMLYVFNDLKRIVTSNVNSATMTFIDQVTPPARAGGPFPGGAASAPATPPGPQTGAPPAEWNETVVPVGRGSEGFDLSPDLTELWVANAQDGTLSIVNVATKRVVQTLAANVPRANRLKFTPDGQLVFVSSLGLADVAVFNAASRTEVKRIKVGTGAAGIQMQPDGSRVFVACTPDDTVVVIDLKSLEVVGRIDAGKQPDGMAWAARH